MWEKKKKGGMEMDTHSGGNLRQRGSLTALADYEPGPF